MKTIYQIFYRPPDVMMDGAISFKEWEVIRETTHYFIVDKGRGWEGRVRKELIDRPVNIDGGGKYYSSEEKAAFAWKRYFSELLEKYQSLYERMENF